MIIGLSCIAVGLFTLALMLIEAGQDRSAESAAMETVKELHPKPLSSLILQSPPSGLERPSANMRSKNLIHPNHEAARTPQAISPKITGLYQSLSQPSVKDPRSLREFRAIQTSGTELSHLPAPGVPVEAIVKLAARGRSELEIASDLELGRDEVALALNINRIQKRTTS